MRYKALTTISGDNQAATDKKFARDVFRKGDLWYRSGDALRMDSDGRWFFQDRCVRA